MALSRSPYVADDCKIAELSVTGMCFATVATMDVAAGAVAIGAWTGYLPDIRRRHDGLLLYDLQVLRVLWKLYRRFR
jgi:hypothetical protein